MRLDSLLGHCAEVMGLIWADPRPADLVINHFFRSRKYLGSKDRRFIAESVYHALRHRRRLEWLCDRLLEKGSKATELGEAWRPKRTRGSKQPGGPEPPCDGAERQAVAPDVRVMSVFVLGLLEGADEHAVEELAEAAAERPEFRDGSAFVRAAHRFLQKADDLPWPRHRAPRLALEHSLPDWLAERLIDLLGTKGARALAKRFGQAAPVTIRVNTMKAPREAVQAALAAEGHASDPTEVSPFGLTLRERANLFVSETFKRGWFEVQDEGSQIIGLCVDPKPGAKVLDACAGGGGKALHMSALMNGRGEIVAADTHKRRLMSLKDRAKRNDCQNIRIRHLSEEGPAPDDLVGRMDYVLIDAPCTGLGTLRRNPDATWKTSPETVAELAALQRTILERYAPCMRPRGRLVYATCSIAREENEEQVEAFLADHPEFAAGDVRVPLSRYGLERLAPDGGPFLRLWPHIHGTDGFFVAVLQKR